MKVFITGFLLLILLGCSKAPERVTTGGTTETSGEPEGALAAALKEAEAYYAAFLPRMSDDETRLESARATPTELRFESTLTDTLRSELDLKVFDTILRPELEDQARKIEKLSSLLRLGATLVYSYKDKEGEHVTEIRVTPESWAKAPLSPDEELASAEFVFERYVQYSVNFDPSIATLYTDFPKISMTRNYPDGTSQTKTVPGWRYKEFIATVMPLAKKRGDAARFAEEEYEQVGENKVRIKVKQYSVLGGYWSDVTLLVVREGEKWLIAEDVTVSAMPRNAEEKK